jgi:hypothetical protein
LIANADRTITDTEELISKYAPKIAQIAKAATDQTKQQTVTD